MDKIGMNDGGFNIDNILDIDNVSPLYRKEKG